MHQLSLRPQSDYPDNKQKLERDREIVQQNFNTQVPSSLSKYWPDTVAKALIYKTQIIVVIWWMSAITFF